MTNRTMAKHMKAAIELKAQIAQLQAELDKHQDALKSAMIDGGMEIFESSGHKATYKEVTSNRFDSSGFKKVHADLYEAFRKPSTSMRFTLA